MSNVFKSEKLKSLLPYLILAVAIVVAYKIINELSFFAGAINRIWYIISPFFYGFLLAYIISIPCNGIQKLLLKTRVKWIIKRKKMLSIILVFILIALVFSLILNLIIPRIVESISLFIANFSIYYAGALEFVDYFNELDLLGLSISVEAILESLQEVVRGFNLEDVTSSINAIIGVSTAIFRGFLAIISSIYILHEKEKCKIYLSRVLQAFFRARAYKAIIQYVSKLNQNFKQYIYTQTIDGFILGTLATIALYILNSPYFLVLGIMLGIVNYIPYFGSIVGSLVAVVVVAFTQGLTTGAITAVVLLIIQQIDANIIQPKLMSGSFSLSPFLVIVSITVGGAIAGALGMIAAIPIISVLKDIFENIVTYFERGKNPT
jgi:predicted PurR-regulated permease PerM